MINKDNLREAAARFDVSLDAQALERFAIYADFLRTYNEKVNLTAITEPDEIAVKHFEDSLAVLRYADIAAGAKLCDVGTGAGFPGIALLIARPDLALTLIEATNKKLIFINELLAKLELSATLVHMRGEEAGRVAPYRENFHVVTARAVAELRKLAEYCIPLVKKNGVFIAMKAQTAAQELRDSVAAIRILGGAAPQTYPYMLSNGDSRTVITVKKISHTSAQYPRPSAIITKKPL
ncbi:MAG: 16S rRNA (guanine(527)-N(7))-methyltransferase RsmG [Clostridia bacterium]|nr:16S rRNA (guanine(527)-N(7))-methyltransferase RsmG [Clostridia bacterium]